MNPILQGLIEGTQIRMGIEREQRAQQMMEQAARQQEIENQRQNARDILDMFARARPVSDGMIDAPMRTPFYDPITGADTGAGSVTMTKAPVDPGRLVSVAGRQFEAMTPEELAARETKLKIQQARDLLPVDRERAIVMGLVEPEVQKKTVEEYGGYASPEMTEALGLTPGQRFSPKELIGFSGQMAALARQKQIEDLKAKVRTEAEERRQQFTAGQNELKRKTDETIADKRNAASMAAAQLRFRAAMSGQSRSEGREQDRSTRDAFNQEDKLRKEFVNQKPVKVYQETKRFADIARQAVQLSAQGNANAGDQMLINAMNKLIDPNSVVREGEYARTAQGQSVLGRIQGTVQRWTNGGGGLTQPERQQILEAVQAMEQAARQQYQPIENGLRKVAEAYKLSPERIMLDPMGSEPAPMGGMVRLRAPNGQVTEVPADQADHYIKRGAKRVQ
jgi:hypothetical protein